MIKIETHKREINSLLFEPPAHCTNCDRDMRVKEWPEGGLGPYIFISLPIHGLCFYQCLKCGAVMGNIHAAGNLIKIKAAQVNQIVRAENRIILAS
ncbi:MAG: hypothetical protein WC335_09930 [Candidatus Omnitrophota bacterium]